MSVSEAIKPYTVLLVDDEACILKFLSIMLRSSGYRVLTAENGVKAEELIRSGGIDLVVTDILMPQLDGIDLIKQIRSFSEVPIIVLSGAESEEKKLDALKYGAAEYFPKPFDPRNLRDCIKSRLRAVRRAAEAQGVLDITPT